MCVCLYVGLFVCLKVLTLSVCVCVDDVCVLCVYV